MTDGANVFKRTGVFLGTKWGIRSMKENKVGLEYSDELSRCASAFVSPEPPTTF